MVTLEQIGTLVAEAATELRIPAKVLATTLGGDDRSYVEVIMSVADCGKEPCQLMVGLHRDRSIDQLRAAIEATLRDHPTLHSQRAPSGQD